LFFVASKVFWIFLSPIAVLLIAALIGAWQSKGRFPRRGRTIACATILILIVAAMTPLGLILVSPLEDRFPQPPPGLPPPYGIIVLGGAINGPISQARGQAVGEEEQRVVQAAILAKRYPEAKIVFTGGTTTLDLFESEPTEATEAKKLLIELGVDPGRIILEDRSRNTVENARFSAAVVHPEPSQPGSSSPRRSTCLARWASSGRPGSTRSPIQSPIARRGNGTSIRRATCGSLRSPCANGSVSSFIGRLGGSINPFPVHARRLAKNPLHPE
jgi:DUF218 domain